MTLHVPIAKAKGRLGAITQIAFFVALALLAARCTILEAVREPFQVSPGVAPYPRGPGASTSLALDLLSCVPAMLVILRAAIDRGYAIRHSASIFLAVILTAWLIFSIKWANDKFAAMISAADFAAAIVLLWTAMQLVRSWLRMPRRGRDRLRAAYRASRARHLLQIRRASRPHSEFRAEQSADSP